MKENSIQVIKPIARKRRFKRKLVMHKFLRFLLISFLIVMLVIVWRSAAGEQNSGVPKGGSESNMTENIPVNEDWRLRLVNSGHSLPADYPVQLEKVQGSHQVDERIAGHVTSMIQAAGDDGVDLLICSSYRSVGRQQELFDEEIDKYNEDRRELDKRITDEAVDFVDNRFNIAEHKSIVLYNETWHKGIIGIVASRLTEKYYRPAIVLTKSGGMISGSARSVNNFDVYKAIEACKDILENFGGHTYAAGLTLKEENLSEFKRRFDEISFEEIESKMMQPQITVDAEISLNAITPRFVQELALFNPFGPENENPVFVTRGVLDAGGSKLVGRGFHHIKLELVDRTVSEPVQAIAFSSDEHFKKIKEKQPVDVCYTIEENRHGGSTYTQLLVRDIKG